MLLGLFLGLMAVYLYTFTARQKMKTRNAQNAVQEREGGGSRLGVTEIPRFTRNDGGGGEAHKIFGCRDSSAMRTPRNDGISCSE